MEVTEIYYDKLFKMIYLLKIKDLNGGIYHELEIGPKAKINRSYHDSSLIHKLSRTDVKKGLCRYFEYIGEL